MSTLSTLEDIVSFVVLRIFAKRKKGLISEGDFSTLCTFDASEAIQIVTTAQNRKVFEEFMDGEIRKTIELLSDRGCGRCHGSGVADRQGARLVICRCVHMVHYRGDAVLPVGEQFSNQYFTGEFSKTALGSSDTVRHITSAVLMFIMPQS